MLTSVVEVRTFLRMSDGSFKSYEEVVVPPPDSDYVEGAIELVIDGMEVIGLAQWDLVDQLWAYIAKMVKGLREQDEVSTYFPDCAVQLKFVRTSPGWVLVFARVGSGPRKVLVAEDVLVNSLQAAAIPFFRKMAELLPGNRIDYALALRELTEGDG